MNDEIREKLSAYLDGALAADERSALEAELARSEELRLELEALRAVSDSIKSLPKEKLPEGFMARLNARHAAEISPARPYFILPPAYRPLAFALSTAVVALVVWDRTRTPEEFVAPYVGWEGDRVAIKSAAEAPASIDVSGALSSMGTSGGALGQAENSAEPQELKASAEKAGDPAATYGKKYNAPGRPLGSADKLTSGFSAPAAAPEALADDAAGGAGYVARSEEERSAINERLYKGFEEEKRRMGITRIVDKDSGDDELASGGRELMALQAPPAAPRVSRAALSAVRGASAAKAKSDSGPLIKAIAVKSVEALNAAWAAAGLPGEPPAVDFSVHMAVFLAGPEGSGIVSVEERRKFIVVTYKSSGFAGPASRVSAVGPSAKPVVVKAAK